MAPPVTLYKFQVELSDISRSVYDTLEFRVAQHPSEALPYMLTRVIAYCLNISDDLNFAPTGLHDPDASAIQKMSLNGQIEILIEIGSPSAKKLHKASKSADAVKVYTYKNPEQMFKEIRDEKVYRASEIEFYSISPLFLDELSGLLKKDNRWGVLFDDGQLTVQVGEASVATEIVSHRLES